MSNNNFCFKLFLESFYKFNFLLSKKKLERQPAILKRCRSCSAKAALAKSWKGISLEDIDNQWQISKNVHPSHGQQLAHFAMGIQRVLISRNDIY